MPSLRKLVNFGSLPVGDVPRVVGTLATIEALSKFAPSNQVCDIAEVRLDEIGTETNWLEACRAIEGELIPTLLTLRSVTEGGKCSLGESEMIKVLESALSCVSAIDVEFKSRVARKVAKLAANAGKVALISYHDFSKTPDLHSLRDVIKGVRIRRCDQDFDFCELFRRSQNTEVTT